MIERHCVVNHTIGQKILSEVIDRKKCSELLDQGNDFTRMLFWLMSIEWKGHMIQVINSLTEDDRTYDKYKDVTEFCSK
jgi:hypothetical protein